MQRVTFTNSRGESIEIYESPFFLAKIEGLGDVAASFQTQKAPGQDGNTYINSVLEERSISIDVIILKDKLINRKHIARIFNPKLGPGLLTYENDLGVIYEIGAVSEHVPKFADERPRLIEVVEINLICNNPYWTTVESVEEISLWEGGIEFPLELPTQFAVQSATTSKIIENEGDVETPIFVRFEGPAKAPIKIANLTTGEFIEINQDLLAGENILINTTFGQKRVLKVDESGTTTNVFHYINVNSTFFNLIPGNNLLDYSTGNEEENTGVLIVWRNRYLGI